MKIAIGCDHGGYELKEGVLKYLKENGYEVIDCGTNSIDSCDYPIYGKAVGTRVANHDADFGIVICTTGEGIMMMANKVKGIRCGIGYNDTVTRYMRAHNNANIISFGAKFTTLEEAINRIEIFVHTSFEGGRHERRVSIIDNY